MPKKKSIIIEGIVAVILAVVLIVVLHPSGTGKDAENKMEVTTTNYQTTIQWITNQLKAKRIIGIQ